MEQLYRWVNMPTLPKEIGEYLVEYTNGRVEKIGYYPFPKESFYYGTDGLNHLIKRWLEPIEESEQDEYWNEMLKSILDSGHSTLEEDITNAKQSWVLIKR